VVQKGKMKKLLAVILSLLINTHVYAESQQVQFIKGMYELNVFVFKGVITEDNDLNIYQDVDRSFF